MGWKCFVLGIEKTTGDFFDLVWLDYWTFIAFNRIKKNYRGGKERLFVCFLFHRVFLRKCIIMSLGNFET